MTLRSAVAVSSTLALTACQWFEPPATDDVAVRLLPKSEDEPELAITARELRQALARRRVRVSGDLDAPPLAPAVQKAVLEEIIETRLFAHEAQRRGLTVSSTTVEAELSAVVEGLPPGELERRLNRTYQTEGHLRAGIESRLLTQELLESEVDPRIADAELEAVWASWPAESKMEPPRVRAAQIVVSSEQAAKEVAKELRNGVAFEKLAMDHSVAPNATAGGYLGWFARDEMPEIVDETCFSLEPGATSDIVPSEYGYHLFKVYERRDGHPLEIEDARRELEQAIMDERLRGARDRLEARLRARWAIKENESVIEEVFEWER